MIDFRKIIEQIHESQKSTIVSLKDFRAKGADKGVDILKTQSRGLYLLWCRTNFNDITIVLAAEGSAHVPIKRLLDSRKGLNHVCKIKENGFTIVYNGICGYTHWKSTSAYGLGGRINQECASNDTKTGTLNFLNRGFEIEDWKVNYFNLDDTKNDSILKLLDLKLDKAELYQKTANTLEILWRLHYGTPIFCRH